MFIKGWHYEWNKYNETLKPSECHKTLWSLRNLKFPIYVHGTCLRGLALWVSAKKGGILEQRNKFNDKRIARRYLKVKLILLGINHIHSKNIMHRDIKLENLLFKKAKYLFKF
jgi:serine/threonine protein kinase